MNDIEEIIKRANDYENSETWDREVADKYADAALDDIRYLLAYIEKRERRCAFVRLLAKLKTHSARYRLKSRG